MGRGTRSKPEKLGKKLLKIRTSLGLSQNEIIRELNVPDKLNQYNISYFERGLREPSLPVLLNYARLAGVCVDVLIDDDAKLPNNLPAKPRHLHYKA